MAYDYTWLRILIWDGDFGGKFLVTGECKMCFTTWASLSKSLEQGEWNVADKFRKHEQKNGKPCPAGEFILSPEYERYKLKVKTPKNAPAHFHEK